MLGSFYGALPLVAALAVAAFSSRANADATASEPSTISVTAVATVTSQPDRAELDLGVVTRASSSQQAADENARVLEQVLAALRGLRGARLQIETIGYTLQPDYEQDPQQGREPKVTGYTASNVVRVRLEDFSRIGTVIDTATRAGANQVRSLRFTLADEGAARARALRAAALDARGKAASVADALGLEIVRITSVVESDPTPRPMYEASLARGAATTPILAGAIETSATVVLTVEVRDQG